MQIKRSDPVFFFTSVFHIPILSHSDTRIIFSVFPRPRSHASYRLDFTSHALSIYSHIYNIIFHTPLQHVRSKIHKIIVLEYTVYRNVVHRRKIYNAVFVFFLVIYHLNNNNNSRVISCKHRRLSAF